MFFIHLHQSTGEIQTVFTSESRDEITQLWQQECSVEDEHTELDVLLTLSYNDVVFDSYLIPSSSQTN
jgi:hypothetical protein